MSECPSARAKAPDSQPGSPGLQAMLGPSWVISYLVSWPHTGEAARKGGSWQGKEGERTGGQAQMAEQQIELSGQPHGWRPHGAPVLTEGCGEVW